MLASLLALTLVPEAEPATDEVPSVGLEFDLSALPDDDVTKGLEIFLTEHQTEVILDAGLEVAADAPLVIRTRVSRYGDGGIHSRADIALLEVGGAVPRAERTVECELCRDGDLVMRIGEAVSLLSARALYSSPALDDRSSDVTDATNEPSEPEDEPRPADEDDAHPAGDKPRAIGRLGNVGIGALVVGATGLASGLPLALRGDQVRVGAMGAELRNPRPAGLVLTGVGGALLATGAVLVSVDVARRHKRRRVSILPGPTTPGLSVRGSF
ncbi:MAG: hypothetical protein KDK70_05145 [Myxococcales bacterium]|nr:hypothetical protein [Myxococcales bacterium]